MALPPLATTTDLVNRSVDMTSEALVTDMVKVASATVRGAAGSPILQKTSTVKIDGWRRRLFLPLPGPPIISVQAVRRDGIEITDWRLNGDRLWRACGWGVDDGPCEWEVDQTHGLLEVPADIVDLVCALTAAGIAAAGEGYASHGGVVAERIDDYSVTYASGAEAVASVMELPRSTREWLAGMFGGSAATVKH